MCSHKYTLCYTSQPAQQLGHVRQHSIVPRSGVLRLLLCCLYRLQLGQQRLHAGWSAMPAGEVRGMGSGSAHRCISVATQQMSYWTAFRTWILASLSRTSCSSLHTLVSRIWDGI